MPARPHGTFAWNEIASSDVERAKSFYAETLGWTFHQFELPGGPYWVVMSGDEMVGGLGGLETGPLPGEKASYWFSFVEVDNIDARVSRAEDLGATIIEAPNDVPNVGRVAVEKNIEAFLNCPRKWTSGY